GSLSRLSGAQRAALPLLLPLLVPALAALSGLASRAAAARGSETDGVRLARLVCTGAHRSLCRLRRTARHAVDAGGAAAPVCGVPRAARPGVACNRGDSRACRRGGLEPGSAIVSST